MRVTPNPFKKGETPAEESPMGTWLEAPKWDKSFVPFGDRLDFLSPENQQLNTGRLKILPPTGDRKRDRDGS